MIPLVLLLVLGVIVVLFVTVGMSLDDLSDIKARRSFHKHPHARKWRQRPPIMVIIDGGATDSLHQSIRSNGYRKLYVANEDQLQANDLRLRIIGSTVFGRQVVRQALQRLTAEPKRKTVIFTPIIQTPRTTLEFLRTYALLAQLPFVSARSGFGVPSQFSLSQSHHKISFGYSVLATIIKLLNLTLFIYGCYAAAMLNQPELILIYLCALSFWLVWSILRYPYLSFFKKIAFLTLLPTAFVYFVFLVIASPFSFTPQHADSQNAIIKV